jgi:ABC-type transporter Mla maintaining outer membrane lipid asymmetry ATPase subunit MlaF
MSGQTESVGREHPLQPYSAGEDRNVRFAEDILEFELADILARILRAVTRNKHLVVVSGSGVGKSFTLAVLNLAFLYTNPDPRC